MEGAAFCKAMRMASDDSKDVSKIRKEGIHAGRQQEKI